MADETLGMILSDVARLYWRRIAQVLAGHGHDLHSAELRVLMRVVERPGERQSRLAEALFIEPMTLTGHLDRLEKKGLIDRRPDPADRRAKQVVPGPDAAATLARCLELIGEVRAAQTSRLAESEIPVLRDLLVRMRAGLAADGETRV